jgi:hypothetical protein
MRARKVRDPDYYANLTYSRNESYDDMSRAFDHVRGFIAAKGLVLVGGMAIDYALRLKGDHIYSDAQIPDYDCYSPQSVEDARELGDQLCKAGFPNVSVIQAAHITTMRVRVDFEVVADITYCPPPVYEQMPTLQYENLRIIHPHYQMIDQHCALSMPFAYSGATRVIFHRWKKDMQRYDKLYSHYPIIIDAPAPLSMYETTLTPTPRRSLAREQLAAQYELPMVTYQIPLDALRGSCICGWGAINWTLEGNLRTIDVQIPDGEPLTLACDDYKTFIAEHGLTNLRYFAEYFGKIPRRIVADMKIINPHTGRPYVVEIYDTYGMKISASPLEGGQVWMAGMQFTMLYLLIKVFSHSNPHIRFTAEEQYLRCREFLMGDLDHGPSIEVYGTANFTHSHLNARRLARERIYGIKSQKQLQPLSTYPRPPACHDSKPPFDPTTSPYFKTDNSQLESFVEFEN